MKNFIFTCLFVTAWLAAPVAFASQVKCAPELASSFQKNDVEYDEEIRLGNKYEFLRGDALIPGTKLIGERGDPYSNTAISFGRLHARDQWRIAACRVREEALSIEIDTINNQIALTTDKVERSKLRTREIVLSTDYQFYYELREVMEGIYLPWPGTSDEELDQFFKKKEANKRMLREAHIRLRMAETQAQRSTQIINETSPRTTKFGKVTEDLQRSIADVDFYSELIAKISGLIAERESSHGLKDRKQKEK